MRGSELRSRAQKNLAAACGGLLAHQEVYVVAKEAHSQCQYDRVPTSAGYRHVCFTVIELHRLFAAHTKNRSSKLTCLLGQLTATTVGAGCKRFVAQLVSL